MTPELTAALARARSVARSAVARWGEDSQALKLLEETGELSAAFSRYILGPPDEVEPGTSEYATRCESLRDAFLDELADVIVVVSGFASAEEIASAIHRKIDRFQRRLDRLDEADRKASAMEARMDRIDAEKEKTGATPLEAMVALANAHLDALDAKEKTE